MTRFCKGPIHTILSVLEFSWFKMSEEVNSCGACLINQMRMCFACHHLSHKDVYSDFLWPHCLSMNLYWFTLVIYLLTATCSKKHGTQDLTVTLLKTYKQPVFHLLRCWDSLDCLFENCCSINGVQRILENWMHLKPDDSEIMCGPSCGIIAISMILAWHLFTLVM